MEEVRIEEGVCMSLAGKRLEREEYWYRELNTIYPFGLNDNVGHISRNKDIVVWTLFNTHPRKFRKRDLKGKTTRNQNQITP